MTELAPIETSVGTDVCDACLDAFGDSISDFPEVDCRAIVLPELSPLLAETKSGC